MHAVCGVSRGVFIWGWVELIIFFKFRLIEIGTPHGATITWAQKMECASSF